MTYRARLPLLILATAALTATAHAQFGAGVGLAAVGDNVYQAGGAVADLLSRDSITYDDISGNIGFYAMARVRFPIGPIRLLGDAGFVYFQNKEIVLKDAAIDQSGTASATFEVGTNMIPINVGAALALPTPVVSPYLGLFLGYTRVNRTYTYVSGNSQLNRPEFSNEDAGDPELGVAVSLGTELKLGPALLDLGARYNMSNVFTRDEDEKSTRYLQVGASLMF